MDAAVMINLSIDGREVQSRPGAMIIQAADAVGIYIPRFCYHEKFKKSNYINEVKFLKGLEYFLEGYNQNQSQILKFIEYCQSFENDKGYLTQSFFKMIIAKKAKFISGPFTDMIFEIIEKQKNKLKI